MVKNLSIIDCHGKYYSSTKKDESSLLENGQFKTQKPNKRVANSSTSMLEYTILSYTNLSIDRTKKKKSYLQ